MSEQQYRRKLIEVALPLEAINVASAREKSIRHGHPSTLHLWWARRPLAACRAVIFGQLVDDPSSWPERFPTEEEQEQERLRLFKLIGGTKEADYKDGLVAWESSTDERILNAARYEIARSVAWNRDEEPPTDPKGVLAYLQEKAPPIYDPFCGGGSIPLEAQRLGLRAYGSDLNPVAVLISKALVEIPPKFAGQPPVNPDARAEIETGGNWNAKGAQGLAEDVRYYGQWMRDEAETRIGHFYPKIEVTAEAVRQQPNLKSLQGQTLTVIAWLWARTVASPNPAARSAYVPLINSFVLSTKNDQTVWVEPILNAQSEDGYGFKITSGRLSKDELSKKKKGTKSGRGANFICVLTSTPISKQHIRTEFQNKRAKSRLIGIVADSPNGRVYLPPTREHENTARSASPVWRPDAEMNQDSKDLISGRGYGFTSWDEVFSERQLVALTTYADLLSEVSILVRNHACAAGRKSGAVISNGSSGDLAYADAVTTYLGLALSKMSDAQSSLVRWKASMGQAIGAFGRQALPMVWDYAESNPFAGMAGDYYVSLKNMMRVLERYPSIAGSGASIVQCDATSKLRMDNDLVVCTDPPYYDNIGYSDLSDYFYLWLRYGLKNVWPDLFRTVLVPKQDELVAAAYRHGSREQAEEFFRLGISRALISISTIVHCEYPLSIYYAFKQSEIDAEGVASTGWATFLDGVMNAGLMVDATLPVRSELSNRMIASGTNALASSIVLVCRKRSAQASVTTRAGFLNAIRQELPGALKLLQQGSIAPVDMAQASIGPGMAVFSRYAKVLEADDRPMSVKTALQLINAELDSFLSEQEAEFDAWTRFAVTWFEGFGEEDGPYGDAETLATARGVAVSGVQDAGLVEARSGKVRLIPRERMPSDWDPATDDRLTVWECTQHLIRRLDEQGEAAAADLLARLGDMADPARDLAYRLFGICERKKWAEEGRAYNGLVIVWPDLVRMASESRSTTQAQNELGF